jgi:polyhydroxyalkanoate synthesis regulator phasin
MGKESDMNDLERIDRLERQLAELRARLPKHSVPPAMMVEMEELEEELETLKARVHRDTE